MKSDQSAPLSEALQHFSDPNDWKELVSLQRYATTMIVLGGPETEDERRHWRYHRLKARLETDLLAKLSTGSLQATGFECPVGLDDERRLIRAEWWEKLEPDFEASEAKGPGGLHVVDIRVQSQLSRTARTVQGPPRNTRRKVTYRRPNSARTFGAGCSGRRAGGDRAGKRSTIAAPPVPGLAIG